jgi:bifunctional DNase/RNase
MQCEYDNCDLSDAVRFVEVKHGILHSERGYCEKHAETVLEEYMSAPYSDTASTSDTAGFVPLNLALVINEGKTIEKVLLRETGGTRSLILPVAYLEMCLLYYCIDNKSPYRPLFPHATMARLATKLGWRVTRVAIDKLSPAGFFEAKATFKRKEKEFDLQVRPSDGLCLAIVSDAPFVIDESLLKDYKFSPTDGSVLPDDAPKAD